MTVSLQDEPSIVQRLIVRVGEMRFFSISLLLHMILVISLGGVVLFKKAMEVPDFEGDGDFVGGGDAAEVGPPPAPEVNQPTFQPTVAPVAPPVQTMSALTTTSSVSPTFSMSAVPTAMPNLSNKMLQSPASESVKPLPKISATALPTMMAARSTTSTRRAAMSVNKGKDASEQAVLKALRWLQANQNPDGSWGELKGSSAFRVAMTGLSLLSFLGHGDTNASPEFGSNVSKAIDYLIKEQSKPFSKGGNVYSHAIATYALGEAYTMTKLPSIEKPVRDSIATIVKGQTRTGGWIYGYAQEMPGKGEFSTNLTDTSVLGWQVQALKAAHLTGLNIPGVDEAIGKSINALKLVRGPKGGFGYNAPADRYPLTGAAALVLQIEMQLNEPKAGDAKPTSLLERAKGGGSVGNAAAKKMASEAVDFILATAETPAGEVKYNSNQANLYAWYYHTQACLNHGGSAWTKWNSLFQDEITKAQNPDGSWPEVRGSKGGKFGAVGTGAELYSQVYRTALCTLMLEVFYRYLPTNKALAN